MSSSASPRCSGNRIRCSTAGSRLFPPRPPPPTPPRRPPPPPPAPPLPGAADQPTFQSITSQLYQEQQALASAIYLKQTVPVSYNAGVGKVIVISLSRQVLTAYQDGSAVVTTFIATGRPQLPTPPGVYHIFHR